jgi:dTDP-4-amino-4,6-dideoxygalactose transaminase
MMHRRDDIPQSAIRISHWEVPLFDLQFDAAEEEAVLAVLRSGWLTQGERVAQFERAFAERMGSRFACAVSSCTAGLHLAAHALGLGPGDEVILPSLTFVATANTIVQTGATPVFADVESWDRPLLDTADVERKLTPRTRAVVAVHYAGHPCNMADLADLARRRNLRLIEDCAHAPLAEWEGRKVGTFGDAGVFSFFSNKNLSTGEGGMIVTDDPSLAERFALLRSHGMTHQTLDRHKGHAFGYDVVELGFNYRYDEIRAAIGMVQLAKLESNTARRAECAARYRDLLREIAWIQIPFAGQRVASSESDLSDQSDPSDPSDRSDSPAAPRSVHHIFPIILLDGAPPRDRLMRFLRDRGIQTSIHFRPVHDFSFYRRRFPTFDGALPVTSALAPRLLTLPLYPTLTPAQQDKVVSALAAAALEH